jgi:hypothetical protein
MKIRYPAPAPLRDDWAAGPPGPAYTANDRRSSR